jgi:hypothetical protein
MLIVFNLTNTFALNRKQVIWLARKYQLANLEDWLDRKKLFDKLKRRFSEVDNNVKIFSRKDEWSKFSTVRQKCTKRQNCEKN